MPNRLADTTSPYLLQHAHNPVDWYPWGPEALERARDEERPILLSIGYSACHWCHVMERESFEDPATAELMNARFVNVKVDREERPDVDQIYMRAVQSMTGSGGWPLTAFLTPDGEPFYGGTYFPPEPRHGMPSFRQVLVAAADAWAHRRDDVRAAADRLVAALRAAATAGDGVDGGVPDDGALDEAVAAVTARYDRTHGGFGGAPKFPQPTTLEALLRHHLRTGAPHTLEMVVHTLRRMAAGGIRDHLAGGFHRYSVDARWLVPHFEKMLYDNALLARLYLEAWKVSGADDLRAVCASTLDYVLDDLQAPEGGFYAARDADSEGEEGLFYVWTPDELRDLLGEDADEAMAVWGVTPGGNFEGRSILYLPVDLDTVAARTDRTRDELDALLDRARTTLLAARAEREPPLRDEKVLVSWTAMTIRALAEAGSALDRDDWLEAARRAARFVLERMRPGGRLHRVHTAGRTHQPAFLEDHAALGNALLSLHEATLEPDWLDGVRDACETILTDFADPGTGRLWDTAADAEALVVRPRDPMDTATPSGNSMAAELLARAGHLLDEDRYRTAAAGAVAAEASNLLRFPTAFGRLHAVADRLNAEPVEVAIVGDRDDPATRALLGVAARTPHRALVVSGRAPGDPPSDIPLLRGREPVAGRPAAYVCRAYACRTPVTEASALAAELRAGDGGAAEG